MAGSRIAGIIIGDSGETVTQPSGDAFQTKTRIAAILESLGRRPNHRFGQNFLIDRNLMEKLVNSAELQPNDCVLEVGPGTGSLTAHLVQRAGRVVSVEIDRFLADHLEQTLGTDARFRLVRGDCLQDKSTLSPELIEAVRQAGAELKSESLKLVANLPYDAATPLVIELLISDLKVSRLCFTVQTEVADRFLATPSTRDYGPVGIIVQALCTAKRIAKCPPEAFWPRPKVHSTMIQLDVTPNPPPALLPPGPFAQFVRSMFLHRRKTIVNNARSVENADGVLAAIRELKIDEKARPENLSVEEWIDLWTAIVAQGHDEAGSMRNTSRGGSNRAP